MKVDLHNHSIYSDGLYSIEELLKIAKDNSIDVMALTDHDSCYGCMEAISLGLKYNITVIPGIELSTVYNGESVHIVGLFVKIQELKINHTKNIMIIYIIYQI
jgi:predicted metal-dependent phosphoesterase TrpH